jgi:hypothetical protein
MHSQHSPLHTTIAHNTNRQRPARTLMIVRVVWTVLVGLALLVFVVAVPALYLQLRTPPPAVQAVLIPLGVSLRGYALYLTALQLLFALGCFAVGGLIAWRRFADPVALFASLCLIVLGAASDPYVAALEALHPTLIIPARGALALVITLVVLFLFLFPDGRFVPRWALAFLLLGSGLVAVSLLLSGRSAVWLLLTCALFGAGGAAQIYRYRRVSSSAQRQQTKWVVFSAATDRLLVQLGSEIEAAVGDIKRLVYNLRPPALDELGLLGVIRARATHDTSAQAAAGLRMEVEAPEQLPPLPAAVEVAAYRIVQEGLTNVLRHAHAHRCVVRLRCDTMLHVEICDDGVGVGPAGRARRAGVGMRSMRERAAELGGRCVVEPAATGGMCVRAWLPIGSHASGGAEKE